MAMAETVGVILRYLATVKVENFERCIRIDIGAGSYIHYTVGGPLDYERIFTDVFSERSKSFSRQLCTRDDRISRTTVNYGL